MEQKVITAGFKRCGIYPFNPDVIDYGVPANDDSKPSNSNSSQKAPLDGVTSRQLPLDLPQIVIYQFMLSLVNNYH